MARRYVLVQRPPEDVWAVLADADRYADWVVGTHESQSAQGPWPRPGSAIEYSVRLAVPGSLGRALPEMTFANRTLVRICEAPHRLELEARAGRLGTARIAIDVRPWGARESIVILDEHPLRGPGARHHNALFDFAMLPRHRRMLDRLATTVEESHPEPG